MRIKKYTAKDIREALQIIKGDLGPDAIIISSKKVRGRGVRAVLGPSQIEVTAAVEDNLEKGLAKSAEIKLEKNAEKERENDNSLTKPYNIYRPAPSISLNEGFHERAPHKNERGGESGVANHSAHFADYEKLHRELGELKTLLKGLQLRNGIESDYFGQLKKALQKTELNDSVIKKLIADLKNNGSLEGELLAGLKGSAGGEVKKSIIRLLEPLYKNIEQGAIMAFIGPTGVGKTTTLAKLVAQFALFRNKKAALLTIDTYRIGAVEQLKTYSEIIGVPLNVVNTPEELKDTLQRHRDKEAIFIDTAGRSAKNKEQVLELQRFIDMIPGRRDIFLTLSATTKGKDLSKIIEEYRRLKFNKLIITKIDETLNLGCIVNVADQAGMPVVYVTNGQNVPEDIGELCPEKAAGMVLRGGKQLEGSGL